jgi:hypothetical protein
MDGGLSMKRYLAAFLIAASVIIYGINSTPTGFKVTNGSFVYVNTPVSPGNCVKVDNNSGKDIFVPTKVISEWNDFSNNKPSGVSFSACPTCSGGGFFYQGYCYYQSALNESCDDICTTKGGVNNTGTDYLGNDADDPTRCGDVVRAIQNNSSLFAVDGDAGTADVNALACVYTSRSDYSSSYLRSFGRAQDPSFKDAEVARICACNN